MDYEKKYKESLERAKSLHSLLKDSEDYKNYSYAEGLEDVFPELAESEDERIRKALVELVKCNERSGYTRLNNVSTSSMLSWLEKKGENSVCKVKIGEVYKCIASPTYTCFRAGDIYHVKDKSIAKLIDTFPNCFVLLEKQVNS